MSRFFIKLDNDIIIELPDELDTQGRIAYCNGVIGSYPEYFQQQISKCTGNTTNAEKKVERRLEIMANYIISSSTNSTEYPILTTYKEKRNRKFEVVFSELEQKYDYSE